MIATDPIVLSQTPLWQTVLSVSANIVSILMGGISIWIAFWMKGQADRVNKETTDLLIEVRTDAKAMTNFAKDELGHWGDTGRQIISAMGGYTGSIAVKGAPNDPKTTGGPVEVRK
jgi:hypothetical protein